MAARVLWGRSLKQMPDLSALHSHSCVCVLQESICHLYSCDTGTNSREAARETRLQPCTSGEHSTIWTAWPKGIEGRQSLARAAGRKLLGASARKRDVLSPQQQGERWEEFRKLFCSPVPAHADLRATWDKSLGERPTLAFGGCPRSLVCGLNPPRTIR